jgi:hypothetical protein
VKSLFGQILIREHNSAWALSRYAINRAATSWGRLSLKALISSGWRHRPVIVEIGAVALLALSLYARGADSTRGKNAMNRLITSTVIPARAVKIEALANMTASYESFCLATGIEELAKMMENDARTACGPRHARQEPNGASLGQGERRDWLSLRQRGENARAFVASTARSSLFPVGKER